MPIKKSTDNATSPEQEGLTRYILNTNIPEESFSPLPLDLVLRHLNTRTVVVDTTGPDIVVMDVPFCELYIPKIIYPNRRLPVYRAMVHCLVYNNPGIPLRYVLSYIYYVNQRFTLGRPMPVADMVKTLTAEYEEILQTGRIKLYKTRRYHTNPRFSRQKRLSLAAQARGIEQIGRSVGLIQEAVNQLRGQGTKPTAKKVKAILKEKLSLTTVKRHWRMVIPKETNTGF